MAASLETNKTLAALLTAGIIASGSGVISRILYHPSMPEENAYVIEVAEVETGGGEAAKPEAVPLPVRLAEANPEEGTAVAKKCAACHSLEKGGPIKIGPPLWGVVGRDIASVEGFDYSDALLAKEGEWTFEHLDQFVEDPKGWAPGTKMAFAGVKDPDDRADLLVYLRTLADQPVPLPEVAEGEAAEAAAAPKQAGGSGAAAAEAAPEEGAAATAAPGAQEAAEGNAAGQSAAEAGAGGEQPAEAGEQTAALEKAAPEGAAPAGAGDGVGALLAQADLEAGAKDARKCGACHSFEEGGPAKIGPPLWGVVGRDIAAVEDFAYSDALAEKEGAWDYQKLDAFLAKPREWAPGTKMAFAGLTKPEERADVILYLRSLSNDPAPLP